MAEGELLDLVAQTPDIDRHRIETRDELLRGRLQTRVPLRQRRQNVPGLLHLHGERVYGSLRARDSAGTQDPQRAPETAKHIHLECRDRRSAASIISGGFGWFGPLRSSDSIAGSRLRFRRAPLPAVLDEHLLLLPPTLD